MKKIITPERIKILCAAVLLCCIALPFSSCSREYDEDGKLAFMSKKPVVETVTEFKYPLQIIKPDSVTGWFFLLSFIWPVPVLLLRRFIKNSTVQRTLWICEPVLVLCAGFILIAEAFLETPAIGQTLALLSTAVYGLTWLYELIVIIIKKIRKKPLSVS